MLKNRAEQSLKRAGSFREQSFAGDMLEITNTIIRYYNETEQQKRQAENAIKLARLFAECMNIQPLDWQKIPLLNADIFNKILLDAVNNSEFNKPENILHDAFTQYDIYTYLQESIKQYDNLLKQAKADEVKFQIQLLKDVALDSLDELKKMYKL